VGAAFSGTLAKTASERLFTAGWIERDPMPLSIHVTDPGYAGLAECGIHIPGDSAVSS